MKLDYDIIRKSLDFAYDKAVNGVVGLDSAYELADDYMKGKNSFLSKANSLINWQCCKAATSGFITGIGGLLTIPVTLPANITSVLFVQVRMIAAIAIMGGYDVKDDRVRSLVYTCLVASSCKEVLKNFGIKLGQKVAVKAIQQIPVAIITKINQAVGFRLLTKFGQKGLVNLGRVVPLLGGIIGGGVDLVSTKKIGNIARDVFISTLD
ncbi:EcsC family protein [uncultured Bacteroides sp.]|uniref:EcsC family protein n=1 Tax=uncultured Bacteroides sp. TaxID=162156 RepID=UPI002638E7F1|nr:EcsC family protein [uncultured Bacteroides sp.]